ncbi:Tuftelin-interacting protein 11 [Coelomomyces lativittatus]|nr:Tuftelin-interacting protein 11 [Coelomomyces lativittatus]KAJ1509764.1 Tuftelin-interacting protein 11 [Coelomomyces lativittatus]KAJ1516084.1 Tuftelin-interacting protein 11 [Coelomomyces lativittatus]
MASDPNFGIFKGTGGLGLKLLMKMGYKPGEALGTTGEGIVTPLEPVIRPKNMGLAFGNFEENPQKKDGSPDISEPTSSATKKRGQRSNVSNQHYKQSKKVEPTYVNSKALIEAETLKLKNIQPEVSDTTHEKVKIIDMRFMEPTEIDADEIFTHSMEYYEKSSSEPSMKHHFSEVLSKLSLVSANIEGRLRKLIFEREQLSNKIKTIEAKEETHKQECTVLENQLTGVQAFLSNIPKVHKHEDIKPAADFLRANQLEFPFLPIDALCCTLVSSYFRSIFASWSPFDEAELGLSELKLLRQVLSTPPSSQRKVSESKSFEALSTKNGAVIPILHSPSTDSRSTSNKPTMYDTLLWHLWLPKVRSAFLSDWDAYSSDKALDFLEVWYPEPLPSNFYIFLCQKIILPKLQDAVETWKPFKHPFLHTWLLPWLTYHFPDMPIPSYFPSLLHKLGQFFELIDPLDPLENQSAITSLTPWRDVWTASTYTRFIQQYVVPKLTTCLSQNLVINPADQDLTVVEAIILTWQPHLPSQSFIPVLTDGFFPIWLQVLYEWLTSPSPNLEEVSQWFETWKSFLPAELIKLEPIKARFQLGSDMMRRALSGITISLPSIFTITQPKLPPATVRQQPPKFTFKDLLERHLERLGHLLIPTNQTESHSGRPIYKIHTYLCYMDQNVLFLKENEEWVPKDLHQLADLLSS